MSRASTGISRKARRRRSVRAAGRRVTSIAIPKAPPSDNEHDARGTWQELKLVNLIRERVKQWRSQGYPGVTRTTLDLLNYWQRDGRQHRLFFAQIEAAEAIIFLNEARADFRQGIEVPLDEPSDDAKAEGHQGVSALCVQDGDRRAARRPSWGCWRPGAS